MAVNIRGMAPLIQVFDMPTSVAFYRDVLGFEVVASSTPPPDCNWVLLRLNGVEVMLNTAYESHQRPAAHDPARIAAHSDTTLYFGLEDLDGAYEHLRSRGLELERPAIQPYGMRQISITDPDGYGLCFHWPANEHWSAKWKEWYGAETQSA
jgi:glyoxylase I family protein